jgi:hypothetical protein
MPSLKLGSMGSGEGEVQVKRPASPVKLKLNLGTIGVQKSLELNLKTVLKTTVAATTIQAPVSDSDSSTYSSSELPADTADCCGLI